MSKHKAMVKGDPFEVSAGIRSLKQAGQRVARKAREIVTGLREGLGEREAGGIRPENIIWIFGAGRTGSTWLSRMMGDIGGAPCGSSLGLERSSTLTTSSSRGARASLSS